MIKASDMIRAAPKYMGTPYSKIDCQAFVEACLKDAGNSTNLAGSNAWYRECMKHGWVGTPEECIKKYGVIPKGAFLFILKPSGNEPERYKGDGIGNASHIGLYTGETGKEMVEQAKVDGIVDAERDNFGNGAMHSSSSRGCVCTSKFAGKAINGGWNRVGLWDQVDYGTKEEGGDTVQVTYTAEVIDGALNLRKSKSTNAERIAQIPEGATVLVTEEDGDWSRVTYRGMEGYVMNKYLKEIQVAPETVAVPKAELEKIYDIIGDWLGLRG